MQAKIDTLRVKDTNDDEYLLYPKTLTRCVTDEDGKTLANMLTDMQTQIDENTGGTAGADGKSAYQIALDNGFEGDEAAWLESLKGEQGEPGAEGRSLTAVNTDSDNNVIATFSDGATETIGNIDVQADFLTTDGFGNLRFTDNKFQYYDVESGAWVDVQATADNPVIVTIAPQPMQLFTATCDTDTMNIELLIKEPNDTIVNDQAICVIEKVIIRRKKDSIPIDENDGDLVLEISRKHFGTYQTNPYIDVIDEPVVGEIYYYKAFPVTNAGDVISMSSNEIYCAIRDTPIYGFTIDLNESDPASMITYIEDNADFESAYMDHTAGTFNYGSWEDVWFISELKPCMLYYDGTVAYELDKNDYSLKTDGTASDIANKDFAGNAMVGIPKVYWKMVDNGNGTASVYFSNKKVDSGFHCWSHIDNNGNEIDYCYLAIYRGWGATTDGVTRLRSLYVPAGNRLSNNMTPAQEIERAMANNTTDDTIWYIERFADRQLINLLLLLIGKSSNCQSVFGSGQSTYSVADANNGFDSSISVGFANDKGLFYGNSEAPNISSIGGVKVFGMEHWWGNCGRWIAGWISDNGVQKIKMTWGQHDSSTVEGFNTTGEGYVSVGCIPSGDSDTFIKQMTPTEYGLIPTVTGGSNSTYFPDALAYDNSIVAYAHIGDYPLDGFHCGPFHTHLDCDASYIGAQVGAAISCKPLAPTS